MSAWIVAGIMGWPLAAVICGVFAGGLDSAARVENDLGLRGAAWAICLVAAFACAMFAYCVACAFGAAP